MKDGDTFREIRLPGILAAGALVLSCLEALVLEPHTVSMMVCCGLPLTGMGALILSIAALRRKRWLRLGALMVVILICIVSGLWLNWLTACNCEQVMLEVFNGGCFFHEAI